MVEHPPQPAGRGALGVGDGVDAAGKADLVHRDRLSAVDKGSNQPNVFVDPKSSESFYPYFSTKTRDDFIQRRYLRAWVEALQPSAGKNPASTVYTGRMVDLSNVHVWAWDARPFPAFPVADSTFTDGPNYQTGHWISGRYGGAPADGVAAAIMARAGFSAFDASGAHGAADGFVVSGAGSPRSALEALGLAFFFDPAETGTQVVFRSKRDLTPALTRDVTALAERGEGAERISIRRTQETEVPTAVRVTSIDGDRDYQSATAEARTANLSSARVSDATVPVVSNLARMRPIAEAMLRSAIAGRNLVSASLMPTDLAVEPGDVIAITVGGRRHVVRLTAVTDGDARRVEGISYDRGALVPSPSPRRPGRLAPAARTSDPIPFLIDAPLLRDADDPGAGYVAAHALPWGSGVSFWRSPGATGYVEDVALDVPGTVGETVTVLGAGVTDRWDRLNTVRVRLFAGSLASVTDDDVLSGKNPLLVEGLSGEWELLHQFRDAILVAAGTYELSWLLRAQRGSVMAASVPIGARVVSLASGVVQTKMPATLVGQPLNWQVGPVGSTFGGDGWSVTGFTFEARARRPLPPARLTARRAYPANDVALSWIRQTRVDGYRWEQTEVPLAEESEAYDLVIRNGSTIVRTVTVTGAAAWTYAAAAQTADFGSPPASLDVEVFQLSASFGRGLPLRQTITL